MKNLKVGDVVESKSGINYVVLEVLTNMVCLNFQNNEYDADAFWRSKDQLKNYTLVEPEKTLEEKFREYYCMHHDTLLGDDMFALAQIADEHYKELNKMD